MSFLQKLFGKSEVATQGPERLRRMKALIDQSDGRESLCTQVITLCKGASVPEETAMLTIALVKAAMIMGKAKTAPEARDAFLRASNILDGFPDTGTMVTGWRNIAAKPGALSDSQCLQLCQEQALEQAEFAKQLMSIVAKIPR